MSSNQPQHKTHLLLRAVCSLALGFMSLGEASLVAAESHDLDTVSSPTGVPIAVPQASTSQKPASGQQRSGEPTGESALMRAAQRGDLNAVVIELDGGADINDQDRRGNTALIYAIVNNHIEIVKVLLKRGASVELADQDGATPLMQAIPKKRLAILKLLIEHGANVNARTTTLKMPPLILASWYGHVEVVRTLLDKGASIEATMPGGGNALTSALDQRHSAVAKLLVERGIKLTGETRTGMAPLDYAAVANDAEVIAAILARGVQVDRADKAGMTALMRAGMRNAYAAASALLDAGANPNLGSKEGNTPLMLAAMNNATKAMAVLLQRGAEINAKDTRTHATALTWATGMNQTEAAQLLIDKNADPNLADKDGRTPLMLAAGNGNELLVSKLLAAKANLAAKDAQGMTAKDWALKKKGAKLVPILEKAADTRKIDTP